MISINDVNALLKENFQKQLQEIKSLPENIARGYKDWVRGLVKQASLRMQQEMTGMPSQEQEQQVAEEQSNPAQEAVEAAPNVQQIQEQQQV